MRLDEINSFQSRVSLKHTTAFLRKSLDQKNKIGFLSAEHNQIWAKREQLNTTTSILVPSRTGTGSRSRSGWSVPTHFLSRSWLLLFRSHSSTWNAAAWGHETCIDWKCRRIDANRSACSLCCSVSQLQSMTAPCRRCLQTARSGLLLRRL